MKLKIFGANLRDQSKGQFVVHAADCADCAKLKDEVTSTHLNALSFEEVARELYSDIINEGSCSLSDAMQEIHFAPCVKFDAPTVTAPPVVFSINDTPATKETFLRSHGDLVRLCADHGAVIDLATSDDAMHIDQCTPAFKAALAKLDGYAKFVAGETEGTVIIF